MWACIASTPGTPSTGWRSRSGSGRPAARQPRSRSTSPDGGLRCEDPRRGPSSTSQGPHQPGACQPRLPQRDGFNALLPSHAFLPDRDQPYLISSETYPQALRLPEPAARPIASGQRARTPRHLLGRVAHFQHRRRRSLRAAAGRAAGGVAYARTFVPGPLAPGRGHVQASSASSRTPLTRPRPDARRRARADRQYPASVRSRPE